MTDADLETAAVAEARGEATASQLALLDADLEGWRRALVAILQRVDGTLTAISVDERDAARLPPAEARQARRDVADRRRRVVRFKRGVEERLRYVNDKIKDSNRAHHDDVERARRFSAWLLGEFDASEHASLEADVPDDLRVELRKAFQRLQAAVTP